MSNGLIIWISTISISIIASLIILGLQDTKRRRSLNGHSLDEFSLWVEKLQSEVDFSEQLAEYRKALITIAMIILAYVKRMSQSQLETTT